MHPALNNTIRSCTRKEGQRLKILTFSTHERYQSNMADVNADFWIINNKKIKQWNVKYAEIPKNHILLNNVETILKIPNYLEFDAVLTQERFGQYDLGEVISKYLHIPLITLEHVCMTPERASLKTKVGTTNIFISKYSVDSWGFKNNYEVIYHGVNIDLFKDINIKRENNVLSVVNDWINRDYECGFKIWQEITEGISTVVVGDTPNLSKPADDVDDLVLKYNSSSIFLNTSVHSPLPMSLIEAMSCGCCVISTANGMVPEIIKNGENGFISNDLNKLKEFLKECLSNKDLCMKLGENARKTIVEDFSLKKFTLRWDEVLQNSVKKRWWK